jgi:DNA repair photolyase
LTMKVIYEPAGAAREYSPLAANLYRGCPHGCLYCYAPGCLRMRDEEFHGHPAVRAGVLDALRSDARSMHGDPRPVLLCFTCDPYEPLEEVHHLTRQAIRILAAADLRPRILTKNGRLAMPDMQALAAAGADFGVSLSWDDEERRCEWEPGAGTLADRHAALAAAEAAGCRTWVSVEPVIDPDQALLVIERVAGHVDALMVGKINHSPEAEKAVDWGRCAGAVVSLCESAG